MTPWPEPRGLHPATQWEHSPNWVPWERRPGVRNEGIVCDYGDRHVVAACAHPARSSDRGMGVALVKAVMTSGVSAGRLPPTYEKCPGAADDGPGRGQHLQGGS